MSRTLKTVQTSNAPAAIGPYSQAVICGGMVYASGQLGIDPKTGNIAENFTVQAKQAMDNLKAIVEAAGSSMSLVVSVDVYLIDMGRFAEFNEVYAPYFKEHCPARAAIAVRGLPREGQVEVRCIAALAE